MGSCFKGMFGKKNVYTFQQPYTSAEASGTYRTSTATLQGWNSAYTVTPNHDDEPHTINGSALTPDVTYRDPHVDVLDAPSPDDNPSSTKKTPENTTSDSEMPPIPVNLNPHPDSDSVSSHSSQHSHLDGASEAGDAHGMEQNAHTQVIEVNPTEISVHNTENNTETNNHQNNIEISTQDNNINGHSEMEENEKNQILDETVHPAVHSSNVEVNMSPEVDDIDLVSHRSSEGHHHTSGEYQVNTCEDALN